MRTKSLFHFTKELSVLFSILKNGFWPRFCFEDISWVSGTDFYASPMVCFCDIPLSKLDHHTSFYGSYGIGMSRHWGKEVGLNPVLYISEDSVVSDTIHGIMSNPNLDYEYSKTDIMITLAHTKPLKGRMLINEKEVEKNFYEESEWRFIDTSHAGIFLDEITDDKNIEHYNSKTFENCLHFDLNQIRYLLVESNSEVPEIIDYIYTELENYSPSELKILSTKIVVLDELKKDL